MGNKLRFGIAIPQTFPDGSINVPLVADHLRQAESLGYDSAWVLEQTIGPMPSLEPLTLVAYAAACTSRLKLGIAVLVMPLRSPVHLAKAVASLDHLTGGRLILGLGLGVGTEAYPAFGLSADHRVSRFEEAVRLMKKLWTESAVDFRGRFWQLEKVTIEPKPLQKPHPPLWFGGGAPAALKRAARLADGWMGAGASSSAAFKQALKRVRGYLEEEGRDPSTFPVSKRVYIALDRDKARASAKLQEWFSRIYGRPALALEVSIFGGEDECVEKLSELVREGLDLLLLNPLYAELDQAERLARDVLPKLSHP